MIAVITGDIINSQHADTEVWITRLKNLLETWEALLTHGRSTGEMSFSSNAVLTLFSGIF